MLSNKVKQALKEGKVVKSTFISGTHSPETVRVLAGAGFECIFIDTEHAQYNIESLAILIRECRAAGVVPLVRVPNTLYHLMAQPLDAGAMGLMIPRVESAEQVREVIRSTKYPPIGERGCGIRGVMTDYERMSIADSIKWINEQTMIVIQIETKKAVERLDDILSVEGIDVALIGPGDLSISLGVPGEFSHPIMVETMDRVIEAAKRHNVASGIQTGNLEMLIGLIKKGLRLASFGNDLLLLSMASNDVVGKLRQVISEVE